MIKTLLEILSTLFMFFVGNFANLLIFTSILKEVAHIWMFTYQPPPLPPAGEFLERGGSRIRDQAVNPGERPPADPCRANTGQT